MRIANFLPSPLPVLRRWDNEIGVPGSFSRMLLLLDNDTQALTKEELAFAEKDLERADWKGWTGANLVCTPLACPTMMEHRVSS